MKPLQLPIHFCTSIALIEPTDTVWSTASAFQATILYWKLVICSNRSMDEHRAHEIQTTKNNNNWDQPML